jgi:hypothetical protein
MPEKETLQRAEQDKKEGKSPSTQAGEFVREEIHHIREGKHGARSTKQAIAIGLSKARRSGVKLGVPKKGKASSRTREQAARDLRKAKTSPTKISAKRSRAVSNKLKREGRSAASPQSLSRQARSASRKRTSAERHQAAMKAVQTKGSSGRKQAARKAAKTRSEHRRAA